MHLKNAGVGNIVRSYFQRAHHRRPDTAGAAWREVSPMGAAILLRNNLLVYGVGGIVIPFIGIKLIDMVITPRRDGLKRVFY